MTRLPNSTTTDIEHREIERAKRTLGDLSYATPSQLFCLYFAARAAEWAWLGALNMPRAEGDQHVLDVIEDESRRCWYCREAVVEGLRRRGPLAEREAERLALIAEWDAETDSDPALH
jgi:hypothetical protein